MQDIERALKQHPEIAAVVCRVARSDPAAPILPVTGIIRGMTFRGRDAIP